MVLTNREHKEKKFRKQVQTYQVVLVHLQTRNGGEEFSPAQKKKKFGKQVQAYQAMHAQVTNFTPGKLLIMHSIAILITDNM